MYEEKGSNDAPLSLLKGCVFRYRSCERVREGTNNNIIQKEYKNKRVFCYYVMLFVVVGMMVVMIRSLWIMT
jgi:hypothetical protein